MKKITVILFFIFCLFDSSVFAQTAKELYEQGAELYAKGDYAKAIELLEQSVKLDANFAPAYNTLGLAYKDTNTNLSEVTWYFKTAIQIDPKYLEAYDNLGKAYYGMGQFDQAEEAFKKALEINPNYGGVQFSLAWVYLLGKSRPNDAIFYFKKVLEKTKLPYAYYGLGLAYFMIDERAMVLDMITALRGVNEDKLAEQLENMIRDYYYIPNETGGSLVNINPPPGVLPTPSPQPVAEPALPEGQMRHRTDGFTTKVRMRGTFFNIGDQEKQKKSSVQTRSTTTSNTSTVVKQPAKEDTPTTQSNSSTIEIRGSLNSPSGY